MNNKLRFFRPIIPLTGNVFDYGRVGSGKTWKMTSVIQCYHSCGFKIFDFYGGKRKEGTFWCFPSEEKKLWSEFENYVGVLKSPGAKEYKVNLMYPCFYHSIPKKLPDLPRVKSFVYTIPITSIDLEEIGTVIGNITDKTISLWKSIKKDLGEKGTGEDLKRLMDTKYKPFKSLSIYNNFIKLGIEHKLFSSSKCETALTIDRFKEEIEDRETITVLCDDFIDSLFKWFIPSWFMKNLWKLADEKIKYRKVIGFFREVNAFMKVQDKTNQFSNQTQNFRNQFSDAGRYARSGFYLFCDTQSAYEVAGLIEGQDDIMFLNEMPSMKDREQACEQLKKDKRISSAQIRYLGGGENGIKIHEMVAVVRGKNAKLIRMVQPPRNQCWKPTMGNFFSVWKNKYNSWKNSIEQLSKINEEYEKSRRNYLVEDKIKEINLNKTIEVKNEIEIEKIEKEDKEEIIEEEISNFKISESESGDKFKITKEDIDRKLEELREEKIIC